jgi:hypothetical protein
MSRMIEDLAGEYADDIGTALHLLVQPPQMIRRMQLAAVLLGEVQVRHHIRLAVVDEGRQLRPFLPQLFGDAVACGSRKV